MQVARWTPGRPLDVASSLARSGRHGPNLLETVSDGLLYRTTTTGVPYRIRQIDTGDFEVGAPADLEVAVAESRYRLGETLPVEPLLEVADRVPPVASQLGRTPGYRPPINPAILEMLVSAISSQQVNLRWAAVTLSRLVERYGTRVELDGVHWWRFPEAVRLAEADPGEIRAMQFSTRKATYIVGLARSVVAGELDGLEHDSNERVIRRITRIRGLGRWTADWFLARCLARPDVIAAGDLGVRKAVSRYVVGADEVLAEPDIRAATESWGDGANWAVHLLLERWADQFARKRR